MRQADHVDEALKILAKLPIVSMFDRFTEAQRGIAARAYDGENVTSGQGPANPTHHAAMQRPDQAALDHQRASDLCWRIRTDALALLGLHASYTPPAPGSVDRLIAANEPLCWFCVTYRHQHPGTPRFETPTNVGDRLPVPRLVCSPHYDLIRYVHKATGLVPSDEQLWEYQRTARWPRLKDEATA